MAAMEPWCDNVEVGFLIRLLAWAKLAQVKV